MASINRPINGHFVNHTFVCDKNVGSIRTYKTGLTGLFWHIVGMFIRKYESVGIDVVDTHSHGQYYLYVTPSVVEELTAALAVRVLRDSEIPSSASEARDLSEVDQTEKVLNLKREQANQLRKFEKWAKKGQWDKFHNEHYDWWMFPIDKWSEGGKDTYKLSLPELDSLRNDAAFMSSYRRGVELVALSYGWDVQKDKPVADADLKSGQRWRKYGVRLGKMADSLRLLQQKDYFVSMQKFANQENVRGSLDGWVLKNLELII